MELTRVRSPLPPDTEALVRSTIGCLLEVHRELGPGLSELAYTAATCVELDAAGVRYERKKPLPVLYRGRVICHHRVDILVADALVVEVKSVERLHPVHLAQTVSYLRLTGARVGLVVNFNVPVLREGIRRVVL